MKLLVLFLIAFTWSEEYGCLASSKKNLMLFVVAEYLNLYSS